MANVKKKKKKVWTMGSRKGKSGAAAASLK
jgi:hypothetical protein